MKIESDDITIVGQEVQVVADELRTSFAAQVSCIRVDYSSCRGC